jgi:hypothetical protein
MSSNIFNHKYPRVAAAFTQDRDFVWKHLFSGYELPQKSRFESQTKVLTMGSCFAVNISNALRNAGIDAQALRLHEEANSPLANFYLVDYLRKERWSRYRALFDKEIHASKCHEFRQLVKSAGLFILTLGVGICCFDKKSGRLILRPNSREAIDSNWRFLNTIEVEKYVTKLIKEIRKINPALPMVLTVSPVPIYRSFLAPSAFVDDCFSKCMLRGAVQQIQNKNSSIYYWPTFELFRWMGSHFNPVYGADDGLPRHPNKHLVELATSAFKDAFFRLNSSMTALPPSPPQELVGDL